MQARPDLVAIIEAAYRVEQPAESWLNGVLDAARPALDKGLGVFAYLVDAADPERIHAASPLSLGTPDGWIEETWASWEQLPAEFKQRTLRFATCGYSSQQTLGMEPQVFTEVRFQVTRCLDMFGVNCLDATGRGCVIAAPRSAVSLHGPSRDVSRVWGRIAAHVAAGFRLQRALSAPQAADLSEGADAILGPHYRLEHASGTARDRVARAALREAAVRADRARTRRFRHDGAGATALWEALIAGRWSLLEHFDSDGRRYYVARRNDPRLQGQTALTLREMQVVGSAGFGHSNKLIAYELGLAPSTVAGHLTRAAEKLCITSRVALVRAAAWLRLKEAPSSAGAARLDHALAGRSRRS